MCEVMIKVLSGTICFSIFLYHLHGRVQPCGGLVQDKHLWIRTKGQCRTYFFDRVPPWKAYASFCSSTCPAKPFNQFIYGLQSARRSLIIANNCPMVILSGYRPIWGIYPIFPYRPLPFMDSPVLQSCRCRAPPSPNMLLIKVVFPDPLEMDDA